MADDNAGHAIDESAYDVSAVAKSARPRTDDLAMPLKAPTSSAGPLPDWADKYKQAQSKKEIVRLTGSCVKWNVNRGFGFISRDDGAPDLYAHQRDLKKEGFRSLAIGEFVEFEIGRMDDGRPHAVKVTGPGGVDVQGQPRESNDDDDDIPLGGSAFSEDVPAHDGGGSSQQGGGEEKKAKAPSTKALNFVPRAVKRPAPAAGARPAATSTKQKLPKGQ